MRKLLVVSIIAILFVFDYPQLAYGQVTDDGFIETLAWMVVTGDRMDGVVDGNDIANIQALADDYYDDAIFYAKQKNQNAQYIRLLETRKADLHQRLAQKLAQTPEQKGQNEADRFALDAVKNGTDLEEALIGLSKQNLASPGSHQLYRSYHNSHPALKERLKAIKKHAKSSGFAG